MKTCSYKNCDRKFWAKGFCNVHLHRKSAGSDMDAPIIVRKKPTGGTCTIDGCEKKYLARGYCAMHYSRKRDGVPMNQEERKTNTNTTVFCAVCSKQFTIRPSQKDTAKYCSYECLGKGRSGELSHWWKGGFDHWADKLERSKFTRRMKKNVLARDNYTCQICGVSDVQLHVDHIERWSENEEKRFDITNCRAVCVPCHYYLTFKRKMPSSSTWGYSRKLIKG